MKLKSNKHNRSIYLPVHSGQNKCLTVCPSLTSLASCAFRLSVWTLFLLFSFPSNLSHFYLSFHAFWDLRVFWSKQVFKYCVHFFFIWWLLPPKKEYSELCTCFRFTLAHVVIHQRKIDTDLRNKKPPSCIPQCILFQVEPRLLFGKRNAKHFLPVWFWNICLWQVFVCFKAFSTF